MPAIDDYWNKANGGPYLDTVTIKILPEPTTRVAGLDTGEIDYLINNVPSDQFATVTAMDNVSLSFQPSYYGEWITFNTAEPPFDNVKVRQALNYALDKKAIRQLYYGPDTPDTKATLVYPTMWTFEEPGVAGGLGHAPGLRPGPRQGASAAGGVGRRRPAQRQDHRLLRVDAIDQGHRRVVHRRHVPAGDPRSRPRR